MLYKIYHRENVQSQQKILRKWIDVRFLPVTAKIRGLCGWFVKITDSWSCARLFCLVEPSRCDIHSCDNAFQLPWESQWFYPSVRFCLLKHILSSLFTTNTRTRKNNLNNHCCNFESFQVKILPGNFQKSLSTLKITWDVECNDKPTKKQF